MRYDFSFLHVLYLYFGQVFDLGLTPQQIVPYNVSNFLLETHNRKIVFFSKKKPYGLNSGYTVSHPDLQIFQAAGTPQNRNEGRQKPRMSQFGLAKYLVLQNLLVDR